MKIASLTAASFLAILAFACSSTKTEYISAPTDGGKEAASTSKNDSGSEEEEEDTKKDSGSEEETTCADETTGSGCVNCCTSQHESGAKVFNDTLEACICDDAVCGTECADTLCKGEQEVTEACAKCANSKLQASCQAALQEACGPVADCVAFNDCLGDSACADKE